MARAYGLRLFLTETAMLITAPATLLASAGLKSPSWAGARSKTYHGRHNSHQEECLRADFDRMQGCLFTPGILRIEDRTPFAFSDARIKPARMMLRP